MSIPARKYHTAQTHFLHAELAFDTPSLSDGLQIGTLPAGAMVTGIQVVIDTAFNAGTNNNLTLGTTASGADIAASATVVAGTAGAKTSTAGLTLLLTADTPVFAKYAQTGTAATAGKARVGIQYLAPSKP